MSAMELWGPSDTVEATDTADGVGMINALDDPGTEGEGDDNSDDFYDDQDYGSPDDHQFFGLGSQDSPDDDQHPDLGCRLSTAAPAPLLNDNKDLWPRIQSDLSEVLWAGYKVGLLDGLGRYTNHGMVSISIQVNRLELSEEAVDEWGIQDSDYVVLLIRFGAHYTPLETVISSEASDMGVRFRIGMCNQYRPSISSALAAFAAPDPKGKSKELDGLQGHQAQGGDFRKMFISKSLDRFMEESLVPLVRLREAGGLSWDAANETLIANIGLTIYSPRLARGGSSGSGAGQNSTGMQAQGAARPEPEPKAEEFSILRNDHLGEDAASDRSFPLVAMQFAMRYFVRCTEFCLLCHRRLENGFEALRPHACSNPLCLFQYMELGLGPDVEHEIVTQPSVVDLLVSLCYASVVPHGLNPERSGFGIRDFPVGLNLRVPPTLFDNGLLMSKPIRAHMTSRQGLLTVKVSRDDLLRLPKKQWVVFRRRIRDENAVKARKAKKAKPNVDPETILHALVLAANERALTVDIQVIAKSKTKEGYELEQHYSAKDAGTVPIAQMDVDIGGQIEDGGEETDLYPYDVDFDALPDELSKAAAIRDILDTLPGVGEIRSHIVNHPHASFRTLDTISPAAALLLQWIICSNRSCIKELNGSRGMENEDRRRIPGMDDWFQFLFSQGSPDKELRFNQALQEVAARRDISKYPTIFAWHGSKISNWHSILRDGLDFRKVDTGRAFGNGVYFSRDFTTSSSYARNGSHSWPQSELKINFAMSLNEIINAPDEFASRDPHYVVSQPDWHQCRYLFVRSIAREAAVLDQPGPPMSTQPMLAQAPGLQITNIGPLQIPAAAMPVRHVIGRGQAPIPSRRVVRQLAEENNGEDAEDRKLILGEAYDNAQTLAVDAALTDFRPGSLDISAIPRLAPPAWATNTALRALSREFKNLQGVQMVTPLHELGWYIDFNDLTNLFQWIVELHSFDPSLPLARDMREAGITSIVLEIRFGKEYPASPPFIRVVRPHFLPFARGGGGNVTAGGAMCMELLTNTGWCKYPKHSMENVLLQVRLALCSRSPQARLERNFRGRLAKGDYSLGEAVEAYVRAARVHGWEIPADLKVISGQSTT